MDSLCNSYLRGLSELISLPLLTQSDFLIMPCDLLLSPAVPTNPTISLASVLDRHRVDDNLMTTLFAERAAGGVVEAAKDGESSLSLAFLKEFILMFN